MHLTEKEIQSIIREEARKIVNEGLFNNIAKKAREFYTGVEELEGEPQSASQVMSVNGWKGTVVEKLPNGVVVRCYTKGSPIVGQESDFEDMVDGLNNYYAKKRLPLHAKGIENYNDMGGLYLKVTKQ